MVRHFLDLADIDARVNALCHTAIIRGAAAAIKSRAIGRLRFPLETASDR